MFTTVGLKHKPNDHTSEDVVKQLSLWLENRGIDVVLNDDDIKNNADLIMVAGGDGSLLAVARNFVDDNIPILGINLGRLGFLADVGLNTMLETIEPILQGEFIQEKRALLHGQIKQDDEIIATNLAFNDVVLHRQQDSKIIEFEIYVNNKFTHSQRADGLIVNTATGSTAYALSSGGPIIHPDVNVIALVPICPHTLSNRPFLVHEQSEICIKLQESDTQAVVSFDAQSNLILNVNQALFITQYANHVNLIHPKDYDFFNIVRSKLHWGGKLKNL